MLALYYNIYGFNIPRYGDYLGKGADMSDIKIYLSEVWKE